MKKITKTFITAATLLGLTTGGATLYLNGDAGSYVLDVNPSIHLQTNRMGNVKSIEAINKDAQAVIAGYEIGNKDIEKVIQELVDRMVLNGYIKNGEKNMVMITADSNEMDPSQLERMNQSIVDYIDKRTLDTTVAVQKVEDQDDKKKQASDLGISVGKANLINEIKKKDSKNEFQEKELAKKSVKELVIIASNKGIKMDQLFFDYDSDFENVLKDEQSKVAKAQEKALKEKQEAEKKAREEATKKAEEAKKAEEVKKKEEEKVKKAQEAVKKSQEIKDKKEQSITKTNNQVVNQAPANNWKQDVDNDDWDDNWDDDNDDNDDWDDDDNDDWNDDDGDDD